MGHGMGDGQWAMGKGLIFSQAWKDSAGCWEQLRPIAHRSWPIANPWPMSHLPFTIYHPEGVERAPRPDVDAPVGNGGRRRALIAQIVDRERLEIAASLQHHDLAGVAHQEDLSVRPDR